MYEALVFYSFGGVLLVSGLLVITARNPVHGVLFLVLAFFTAAAIWLLLRAEFLAIALVVVYVGAVMVLFLFVVMMLDINLERVREGFWRNLPLALVVGGIMVAEMAFILGGKYFGFVEKPLILFPRAWKPAARGPWAARAPARRGPAPGCPCAGAG